MDITKKILKDMPIAGGIVTDISGTVDVEVKQTLTDGLKIAEINGTPIYAPKADGTTLIQPGDGKVMKVKPGAFVENLSGEEFDLSKYTLGEYLAVLTEKLGGTAV